MSLSTIHRRLADLIDEIEASGVRVVDATPSGTGDDGTVTAELAVELPVAEDATGAPGEASASSTAAMAARPARPVSADEIDDTSGDTADERASGDDSDGERGSDVARPGDESADPTAGDEADDDTPVACKHPDCDVTFETTHGMKIHYTKVHVGSDADMPAYRDPERLRAAYETHDTLSDVRDALDADVAVTTIRRHLLEHGIHDPDTADDAPSTGDEDGSSPESADAEASGDEPATDVFDADTEVAPGVTVGEFREALHGAATVSGVERALHLDREATVDLLQEYDLLDVVGGRVANKPDRESVCSAVDDRLRDRLTA